MDTIIDADFDDVGLDKIRRLKFLEKKIDLARNYPELNDANLICSEDVELLTGISKHTLATWRYHGREFYYVKIGESIRYRIVDILNHINRCLIKNTAQGDELKKSRLKDA